MYGYGLVISLEHCLRIPFSKDNALSTILTTLIEVKLNILKCFTLLVSAEGLREKNVLEIVKL